MIGKQEGNSGKMFYSFRLNKRVPEDHPLRALKKMLKLDFMYELLKDKYGKNGNVSVPPPTLMKLMLLLVFYNVRSERELMKTLPLRLDWLWFLDYDIDDVVPHHSVLSKARKRWGEDIFEELFERVLKLAIQSGLVDGEKLFADSSLVDADASKSSVIKIDEDQIKKSYEELSSRLDEPVSQVAVEKKKKPPKSSYKRVNDSHKSKTDPESTIVRMKGDARPRYKVHRSVDGANEIITSCKTTTGIVDDGSVLPDLLESHCESLGKKPEVVIADSKYGTKNNFVNLKKQNITSHIRDFAQAQEEGGQRKTTFPKKAFKYHKEGDYFICPAGEKLPKRSHNSTRNWYEYVADKELCNKCKLKPQCTKSIYGRSLKRHDEEELLVLALKEAHSEEAKKDLKTRQHLMERSFATGTRYGYKRARWRGLFRVKIEQLLIATVQNLAKIAKKVDIDKLGELNNAGLGSLISKIKRLVLRFIGNNINNHFPQSVEFLSS